MSTSWLGERSLFFEDVLVAVGDSDLRSGDGPVCVEANFKGDLPVLLSRPLQGEHAAEVRPGDGSDAARRHPELGEADGLSRLEKVVGCLVPEQPGLHLHVAAVVVGEPVTPIERVAVGAPGEELF